MKSSMRHIFLEKPNPKQALFFSSKNRFIAYGGARGGGKSWAVRRKALLLCLSYPGIKILLLRRSYPELRENHILPLRRELLGVATYKDSEKCFTFQNGSRLLFGYCASEGDVLQYQGQEYDIIFIDEATQFTEFQFSTLTACLRGANSFPRRMYLTCNPGGVGHAWVKRLFIDRDFKPGEQPDDYAFIAASVTDNTVLSEKDPHYVQMLENLPSDLRRAWLLGDWNVFAGQYFSHFREEVHIIEPRPLPLHYRTVYTLDYGLDMLACYAISMDENGFAFVTDELYESGLLISEAAEKICNRFSPKDAIIYAPPDLWNRRQDTGKSAADIFAECGIPLTRADNRRVQGWYDMAEWLRVREENGQKTAALRIFSTCKNLIRCLPMVSRSDRDPNDIAGEPHELTHSVDAIRYFCAGRPAPAFLPKTLEEREEDAYARSELREFLDYGF